MDEYRLARQVAEHDIHVGRDEMFSHARQARLRDAKEAGV